MTSESETSKSNEEVNKVSIGNVDQGIHDSIIAGRDVIIYEGEIPVSAGDLLDTCKMQVKSVLSQLGRKYDPALYVPREMERNLNEFLDTPIDDSESNCFLIIAPAGSGKTNLLCDLARDRASQQPVLLLLGGSISSLDGPDGLLGIIRSELEAANNVIFRSAGDTLQTLHRLANEVNHYVLVILDAINEYNRPAQMSTAVEGLLRKTQGKRIKLVITCRDYSWGLFQGSFWQSATINGLPAATGNDEDIAEVGKEFSRFAVHEQTQALALYLEYYEITGEPGEQVIEQCRHPLLLRFFCEAYRGQDISHVEDIRLKELFDLYWSQKKESIAKYIFNQGQARLQSGPAEEADNYLLDIAAYMLRKNVRVIPITEISKATARGEHYDDPLSYYGRIRDEFIILEEQELGEGHRKVLQVVFVYEQFMEYTMARSLIRDWDRQDLNEAQILAEIELLTQKYDTFAQILGVVVYLALMLKEHRGLALWSLLLKQGEQWQSVVFEAIRKLPDDQFDAEVMEALSEMLNTIGDRRIHEQILKTLNRRLLRWDIGEVLNQPDQRPEIDRSVDVKEAENRRPSEKPLTLDESSETLVVDLPVTASKDIDELVRLVEAQEIDPLIAALQGPEFEVRVVAAKTLGELNDPRAVKPLIDALQDTVTEVRLAAALSLQKLGEIEESPIMAARAVLEDREGEVYSALAGALEELSEEQVVGPLIAALEDTESKVRSAAASVLGNLNSGRGVEPLIVVLKDHSSDVRAAAASALGELGDDRAVDPLIAVLEDDSAEVQQAAAGALGKLSNQQAVDPLIALLKYAVNAVRSAAAEALGELGDLKAVEPLITALKYTDEFVRWSAALALGKLGDARAVGPLIAMLHDEDDLVQSGAIWALADLRDPQAINPLIAIFNESGDETSRLIAVQALGKIGDERAIGPLVAAVNDQNWEIRAAIVTALGELGEAQAIDPLLAALKDAEGEVRSAAADALGKLGDVQAVEPLIAALEDTESEVRSAAVLALGELNEVLFLRRLITMLEDPDDTVRFVGALTLAAMVDKLLDEHESISAILEGSASLNNESEEGG